MVSRFNRAAKTLVKTCLPASTQQALRRHFLSRRIANKAFEPDAEMEILRELITPGQTVIDIGANAGAFAIYLSEFVGRDGRVFCFEPIPDTYEILCKVVRDARLTNVETFNMGLADAAGVLEMVVPDLDGFTGFYMAKLRDSGEPAPGKVVRARIETLDGMLAAGRVKPPAFIKCDVEGACLRVLKGAAGLNATHRPNWLIEVVNPATHDEVFASMQSAGYAIYVMQAGRLHRVHACDPRNGINYFFFHPANPAVARVLPRYQGEDAN